MFAPIYFGQLSMKYCAMIRLERSKDVSRKVHKNLLTSLCPLMFSIMRYRFTINPPFYDITKSISDITDSV